MPEHTGEGRKGYWALSEDRKASQKLGVQAGSAE